MAAINKADPSCSEFMKYMWKHGNDKFDALRNCEEKEVTQFVLNALQAGIAAYKGKGAEYAAYCITDYISDCIHEQYAFSNKFCTRVTSKTIIKILKNPLLWSFIFSRDNSKSLIGEFKEMMNNVKEQVGTYIPVPSVKNLTDKPFIKKETAPSSEGSNFIIEGKVHMIPVGMSINFHTDKEIAEDVEKGKECQRQALDLAEKVWSNFITNNPFTFIKNMIGTNNNTESASDVVKKILEANQHFTTANNKLWDNAKNACVAFWDHENDLSSYTGTIDFEPKTSDLSER